MLFCVGFGASDVFELKNKAEVPWSLLFTILQFIRSHCKLDNLTTWGRKSNYPNAFISPLSHLLHPSFNGYTPFQETT